MNTPLQELQKEIQGFKNFYEREFPTLDGHINKLLEIEKEHLRRAFREGVLSSVEGGDTSDEAFDEYYSKKYG